MIHKNSMIFEKLERSNRKKKFDYKKMIKSIIFHKFKIFFPKK